MSECEKLKARIDELERERNKFWRQGLKNSINHGRVVNELVARIDELERERDQANRAIAVRDFEINGLQARVDELEANVEACS